MAHNQSEKWPNLNRGIDMSSNGLGLTPNSYKSAKEQLGMIDHSKIPDNTLPKEVLDALETAMVNTIGDTSYIGRSDYDLATGAANTGMSISDEIEHKVKKVSKQAIEELERKYANALQIIQLQAEKLKQLNSLTKAEDLSELVERNLYLEQRLENLEKHSINNYELITDLRKAVGYLANQNKVQDEILQMLVDRHPDVLGIISKRAQHIENAMRGRRSFPNDPIGMENPCAEIKLGEWPDDQG